MIAASWFKPQFQNKNTAVALTGSIASRCCSRHRCLEFIQAGRTTHMEDSSHVCLRSCQELLYPGPMTTTRKEEPARPKMIAAVVSEVCGTEVQEQGFSCFVPMKKMPAAWPVV